MYSIRCVGALLAAAAGLAPALTAQTAADSAGVRAAVLDYVEGFYEGDSARLVRSVWPEVRKYGYYVPRDSAAWVGEAMPYDEFMRYANAVKAGRARTPAGAAKEIQLFDVQDQTASAKLTAWWGTDYLLLAKQRDGRWMITHVLWQSPPRSASR